MAGKDKDKTIEDADGIKADTPLDGETIPPEILDQMSPAGKHVITEAIGMFAGPSGNPLAKKITSEHITALIKKDSVETKANQDYRASNRNYMVFYVLLAVSVFTGLTLFFAKTDPTLYKEILTHFGALVGGFAAGWGFSQAKSKTA